MNNQEPPKPTGSLEELFRHHFAEAAAPPRPHVWEQVDNALLLAQNQAYRRRLHVARWVAAASLLLASLAGTAWWAEHRLEATAQQRRLAKTRFLGRPAPHLPGAALEGRTPAVRANAAAALAGAALASAGLRGGKPTKNRFLAGSAAPPSPRRPGGPARPLAANTLSSALAASATNASSSSYAGVFGKISPRAPRVADRPQLASREGAGAATAASEVSAATSSAPGPRALASGDFTPTALFQNTAAKPTAAADFGFGQLTSGSAGELTFAPRAAGQPLADQPALLPAPASGAGEFRLSGRLIALAPVAWQPLPAPLAEQALPVPAPPVRRWRLGASYAAGAFQPNLDFSRGGAAVSTSSNNSAFGPNSPALSEAAAREYRAQERAGLSQRLRVQASRHLRGHWSLSTGLELAQQEARSATSYIFTGEPVADFGSSLATAPYIPNQYVLAPPRQSRPRRATTARFRSAGLPVELRYANSQKTGFSLYGRVGAIVSALLTSRTDVEDYPEATRTYTLLSGSTPYRRVLGTVRGAAGVQFRPASGTYTLSLGPVAEGGLWSLNRAPAQGFLRQRRPYSFGLEAGVEFGLPTKNQQ